VTRRRPTDAVLPEEKSRLRQVILVCIKRLLRILGVLVPVLATKLAFRLFFYPTGRSQIRPIERATMTRARTEMLVIRGLQVRVYRWGDGARPVLMMHGWESRGARLAQLAEKLLTDGYSPLTFDSPGHGDSQGDRATILDYLAICRALQERYGAFEAVIAHSFGVLCAFYALKHNVRTRCVVALSGVSDFHYLLDAFSERLDLIEPVKEQLRRRIEQLFAPLDDIWRRFSVTYNTQELQQRVLIIHDIQDDLVSLEQARKSAEHFGARAELQITNGLGHSRILGDPAVLDRVCVFIHRERLPLKTPEWEAAFAEDRGATAQRSLLAD
jgi:pimeloyl-ACP methyl ester carboxylesterase